MNRKSGFTGLLVGLLLVILVLALVVGGCAVTGYNRAIRLDETVRQSWAQVENILQSRYDLVPNLVETVKGYAEHEKEIFVSVADARARYIEAVRGGTQSDRIDAANRFEMALRPVLALQENYPELRAQESFTRLMDALEGTERRLAVERKRYNDAVATLNAYVRGLVGRTFAGWAGVSEAAYFEVAPEAREAPRVRFGTDPADEP